MGAGTDPGETALFGRDRELGLTEEFLGRARTAFGVLRLDGEAGIGKTTVWTEVVRRARAKGFRVLSCRPAETETKLALSAVSDLLEGVEPDEFASLPEPQRHALEIALLRERPEAGSSDPRALATGIRNLLAAMAAERPLLVAIDDVQWLDPSSAGMLAFALRRSGGTRVSWAFAARLPEPAGLAADRLLPPEAATVITLGPLSLAAVHHMLKDRLEAALARPELVRLHEATSGNPLFALEIARAGGPSSSTPEGLPVPDRLRELLADRIPNLPAEAREGLLAAAALSQPTAQLVERASSAGALSAAEESGLIRVVGGRVDFVHPLYASVIYGSASTGRRRELHRRLAATVSEPEERARHLASATTEESEEVALALEEAAALARGRGAWDAAGELLERAGRLTPADLAGERDRRLIAAAEHQIRAGGRSRARALLEEILESDPPRQLRAEALRLLGEIIWHDDDFAGAIDTLAQALECAEEPRLLASIELALGWLQPTFSDYSGGEPIASRALRHAEEAGDQSLVASALALCAEFGFLLGNGVDWEAVERSLELEEREAILPIMWRPSAVGAVLELWVGRIADAREHLNAVLATARERGEESDLAFVLLWLSWLEVKSGNFGKAAELAEEMDAAAALSDSKAMQPYARGLQALVHAHRGEVEEARARAAEAAKLNEANPQPQVVLWTAGALGLLELSLGNPEAAWRACEPVAEGFEAQGIAEPVVTFCLPEALEAMIALGHLERAEALLDGFEGRGRDLDRAWALATGGRCRGLLLAARGDLDGAADALTGSLAAHERIEMPLELGRTLLVKGQVERRSRQRGRAKETLTRALETFEGLCAVRWAERAREEIGRLGIRRSDPDQLTEAERRVAEAAARGMTNREVAATLFLSPKTVEAHLSSVYRKLEISSRAELGARVAPDRQN